jgi:hypothetical protein
MVPQAPIVGIFMIINGSLVICAGFALGVFGTFMFALEPHRGGPPGQDNLVPGILVSVVGVAAFVSGVLNVIGGIRLLKYRGRTFAITALFANIIPLFTCYCLPTSLGVMIYGLIVMFQTDVAQAFELGAQGLTPDEIQDHLHRARRYGRYEDEERRPAKQLPPPEAPEAPEGPIDQRIQ